MSTFTDSPGATTGSADLSSPPITVSVSRSANAACEPSVSSWRPYAGPSPAFVNVTECVGGYSASMRSNCFLASRRKTRCSGTPMKEACGRSTRRNTNVVTRLMSAAVGITETRSPKSMAPISAQLEEGGPDGYR